MNIDRTVLENIFIISIAHSTDWLELCDYDVSTVKKVVPFDKYWHFPKALLDSILDKNITVVLFHPDDSKYIGVLNADIMYKNLELLANDKDNSVALQMEIEGQGTELSADICMQFMIFGKIKY